jgi:hypothetical protein
MAVILRLSIIPLQGTPMMYHLFALDLVLDDVGDDVAAVAAFGHDGHLFFAAGQIVGQVDAAVAVPNQLSTASVALDKRRARSSWAGSPCGIR